jgi:hypothetical protein
MAKIIFCSLVLFTLNSALFAQNNNIMKNDSLPLLKSSKMEARAEKFIELLSEYQVSNRPWISRKEIAAWSAVILYLSTIMVLVKFHSTLKSHRVKAIVFIIFLSYFFVIFIHQQYGSMISSMATEIAINKLKFETFNKGKLPDDIDLSIEKNLPSSLEKLRNEEREKIRQYSIILRPLAVFLKIFNRDISTVEVEEAVLYDILLLITGLFIYSLFVNISNDIKN